MPKHAISTKVSLGALFAMHDAIKDERKNWRVVQNNTGCAAVRAGRYDFTRYPFKEHGDAEAFIARKCLAVGLETLGLNVEALA